ncbi:Ankyrin Repeat Domain-Containing Protein 18A [Manis pentadactyla]|nr:Ankyrin Repeat Domain-Containing Protein 18A [Manis pentadactyla]
MIVFHFDFYLHRDFLLPPLGLRMREEGKKLGDTLSERGNKYKVFLLPKSLPTIRRGKSTGSKKSSLSTENEESCQPSYIFKIYKANALIPRVLTAQRQISSPYLGKGSSTFSPKRKRHRVDSLGQLHAHHYPSFSHALMPTATVSALFFPNAVIIRANPFNI